MGSFFAVIEAIPIVNSWWQQLVTWYIEHRLAQMKVENREAIQEALKIHDQRLIEHLIGSPTEGLPSGIPGTRIIDDLPPGVNGVSK